LTTTRIAKLFSILHLSDIIWSNFSTCRISNKLSVEWCFQITWCRGYSHSLRKGEQVRVRGPMVIN
jgi:predicted aminopeptidase